LIEDLRELSGDRELEVDICVVGAGASGIAIANELRGSGLRVCLAESGGLQEEPDTQALYRGENAGHPMALDEGRFRVFGGSTTRWGGRSATLDPIDFEERPWVKQSGWPFTYRELLRYYERAKVANNYKAPWIPDSEVPKSLGIKMPEFRSGNVVPFVWRYASPDLRRSLNSYLTLSYGQPFDWGKAHYTALRTCSTTHVLLHANMTSFTGSADGSVIESITVKSLTQRSMTIKAKVFVLCCSGIENARLLLNAPKPVLGRINAFDTLGRYFAQHPRGTIATLQADPRTSVRLQRTFSIFFTPRRAPIRYEIGFALSDEAQRKHQLLNASAAIYFEASEASPWKAGRRVREAVKSRTIDRRVFADVATFATGGVSVAQNLGRRYMMGRPVVLNSPNMRLVVDLEQEPNPCSRITLSEHKDALGLRQAKIDWRISESERRTARYLGEFIGQELKQAGMGEATAAAWVTDTKPVSEADLAGNYHFIGATRMSTDPRDGVVNANCKVHGVDNLYVAGCSVFPTGGHANPTLTIVALAIRLADHLRSRLKN
jgi:choline dehydrogenase-like flavoprotein